MPELSILLVGRTDRPEFSGPRKVLEGLARLIPAPDVAAAAEVLADEQCAVDVIVVAQEYPGQVSAEALDRLWRMAPLARPVALLGSWCEGEARSGRPWPGAIRVYWHQWPARCHRELDRLGRGLCSSWCLPPTATEDEHFLALAERPLVRREGVIAIRSPSPEMEDWLGKACRRAGYSTAVAAPLPRPSCGWCPERGERPRAGIFDSVDCRGEELDELRRWTAGLAPAPVVVLMSFPRVEDRGRVLEAGARALLSKPLLLDDLFWQLDQAAGHGGNEE